MKLDIRDKTRVFLAMAAALKAVTELPGSMDGYELGRRPAPRDIRAVSVYWRMEDDGRLGLKTHETASVEVSEISVTWFDHKGNQYGMTFPVSDEAARRENPSNPRPLQF